MDRLAMLQRLAATKADDPFPQYGLAMEYKKLGRHAEADTAFAELSTRHPEYVPAYLMHGNLLEAAGAPDRAAARYREGLAVANRAGDEHAASELQAALDALG